MSIIKLELTEDHIKLLQNLEWSNKDNVLSGVGYDGEDFKPPFNNDSLYEAIDLVLNGKPKDLNFLSFDCLDINYTEEQKSYWDRLYSELPLAVSIVLHQRSFNTGTFKTKHYNRVWTKIK